jgi:hypothetical protein
MRSRVPGRHQLEAAAAAPARAIDSFNSTIVSSADAPLIISSLTACENGGACSGQPLSVALLRNGTTVGETPQQAGPQLSLQPGDPRAGDPGCS